MDGKNLEQPPLNTTLMGCIKGASDYWDLEWSAPMLYGLTGHAFVINIHDGLCPSGPYCWNTDGFGRLLENVGMGWGEAWHLGGDSTLEERKSVEASLRAAIDRGDIGILTFLEFQLVAGYDEEGMDLIQPWDGKAGSEISRFTFSSWKECLESEGFAGFRILTRGEVSSSRDRSVLDALRYALEVYRSPETYQFDHYRVGHGAYENWMEAVDRGVGGGHGNWWNAMVWAECRKMAGAFFDELANERFGGGDGEENCRKLKSTYDEIGDRLFQVSDKELGAGEKKKLLDSAAALEKEAEGQIEKLFRQIEASGG